MASRGTMSRSEAGRLGAEARWGRSSSRRSTSARSRTQSTRSRSANPRSSTRSANPRSLTRSSSHGRRSESEFEPEYFSQTSRRGGLAGWGENEGSRARQGGRRTQAGSQQRQRSGRIGLEWERDMDDRNLENQGWGRRNVSRENQRGRMGAGSRWNEEDFENENEGFGRGNRRGQANWDEEGEEDMGWEQRSGSRQQNQRAGRSGNTRWGRR